MLNLHYERLVYQSALHCWQGRVSRDTVFCLGKKLVVFSLQHNWQIQNGSAQNRPVKINKEIR